jgi:Sigma-70, region 4
VSGPLEQPDFAVDADASGIGRVHHSALPARMASFMELRGIHTLAELARLHPAQLLCESNLGPKTIAATRAILEERLNCVWEDLALGESVPAAQSLDPRPASALASEAAAWDSLRRELPAHVMQRSLLLVALPARLRQFAQSQGMGTVAELVAWPARELLAKQNLGRTSLYAGHAQLLEQANASRAAERAVAAADWKLLLLDGLAMLALRERMILTQRAGLTGPVPTLVQLGISLGVSRERVRQLESAATAQLRIRAPWLLRLAPLFTELATAFATPLQELTHGGRALVQNEEADREPLAFLLREVLQSACGQVFVADGVGYFGHGNGEQFIAAVNRLRAAAENLAYPLAEFALTPALLAASELEPATAAVLLPLIQCDFLLEPPLVVGFGRRRISAILALLRATAGGVSVSQIAKKCGRGPLPTEVVWLDRGLVSLPEMIPSYPAWQVRVVPLVIQIMAEHGESRQWTTAELVPLLAIVADLPTWFNAYTLGSLLKDAEGIIYLGRNVVALTAAAVSERTHLLDALVALLIVAGGPLPAVDLQTKLREQRGMADNTWAMLRMRAPLLLLPEGNIGLRPRDLPGGDECASAFCDAVFVLLERAEHGLGALELQTVIAQQPDPVRHWDVRLARSVLRHDGRFRQAHGGGLGLAVWGDTRVQAQGSILTGLLQRTTRVPIAEALDALTSVSGEPLQRERLASVAASCDARLSGEFVEWDSPAAPAAEGTNDEPPLVQAKFSIAEVQELHRLSLKVPEKAAGLFVLYTYTARDPEQLSKAVARWCKQLDASNAPGLDHRQIDRLAARAQRLLNWLNGSRTKSQHAAVCAAVEYLVRLDDGKGDELVGGLDDDEGVFTAVERAIGAGVFSE